MAVDSMVEYAAQNQAAGRSQSQENRRTRGTTQKNETAGTAAQKNRQPENTQPDEGVRYEVSKRTNEVAAWYQEFLRREQAEQLGLDPAEWENTAKEKEEEKDPVREAMEEAERVVKSLQRMLERMREQQKKQQEKKAKNKGKLSYNANRVSSTISTAKTATQASNALSSAMTNLSMVRRKAASGAYNDREIEIALQHAGRMVRAARKKCANMQKEAQQKKKHQAKESFKKQQNHTIHHAPARQKAEKELLKLQQTIKSRENMMKNRHRREEDLDLLEADMQYLRKKVDLLKNHGLSLSTEQQQMVNEMVEAAMGLVSVEMTEQAANAAEGSQTVETAPVETGGADTAAVGGGFDATI